MPKKPDVWKPTCNRFVAFIDIMGFKDMIFRSSHKEITKLLESFQTDIRLIEDMAILQLAAKKTKSRKEKNATDVSVTRLVSFSDSIILVSDDSSISSAIDIILTLSWIFNNAINQGIPIKGAIAYGEQTADFEKSLHFGRPLIDAYELQNELLLYGAVLHHTMEKYLSDIDAIGILERYGVFKWPAPMKSGKITHYIVNWTLLFEKEKNLLDSVTKLYNNVSGSPRLYVDNTLDFIRWVTDRKAKLAKQNKSISRTSTKRKQS